MGSIFISIFFFPQIFFLINSQLKKTILKISEFLDNELKAVFGEISLPGTIFIFISIFFFIIFNNFMGLFPYIFTRTRHISFTLTLALPLKIMKKKIEKKIKIVP